MLFIRGTAGFRIDRREKGVMALHELHRTEDAAALALARYQAYHTRPSTVAAKEFLGIEGTQRRPLHWQSLPERVEKFCQTWLEWVSVARTYCARVFLFVERSSQNISFLFFSTVGR